MFSLKIIYLLVLITLKLLFLLYLSVGTRVVNGQFCGPYFTARPTEFRKVVPSPCVSRMSVESNFAFVLVLLYNAL